MKKAIVLVAILLVAAVAFAQQSPSGQGATVINSGIPQSAFNPSGAGPNNLGGPGLGRHDLFNATTTSPLGCETCHLPHTAPTYGTSFLWAWRNSPTSVTTYGTETNVGGALVTPAGRGGNTRSMLCLGCHDATTANANGLVAGVRPQGFPYALISSAGGVGSLGSQHPVDALVPPNTDYVQPVAQAGLPNGVTATIGTDLLPLWGNDFRVECASCHDQHNDYAADNGAAGGVPFLRVANTDGTYLCRECHNK